MEIRQLTISELKYAMELSRAVFDYSLKINRIDNFDRSYFEQYMDEPALGAELLNGRLAIWGACEEGKLVGVSALTNEGHITMLYVHPSYTRRKIAAELLLTMRRYAWNTYDLSVVTVNAMPGWSAPYFQKREFLLSNQEQNYSSTYVSLHASSIKEKTYTTRPLSGKAILVLAVVFLCLFFGSTFGYILYFMLTH